MTATTIEQSKHLLELGLDPKTADCMWLVTSRARLHVLDGEPISNYDRWENYPAWSLSALLELMPKNTNETYHLFSSMMADQLGSWVCDRSKYYIDTDGHNKNDYECFKSYNPITAAYEMVCWLLEQKILTFNNKEAHNENPHRHP